MQSDSRRRIRRGVIWSVAGLLLLLATVAVWIPGSLSLWFQPGPAHASRLHRARLLSPSLLRYYRFPDERSLQKSVNLAGWTGGLVPPPGVSDATLVRGADHGAVAVRLDENPLEATPVQLDGGGTIELRFRHLGPGNQPGPNVAESATLAACGDGVWSGFRMCLHYPCNVLTFELGRPKPQSPVTVTSGLRIPTESWVHVVATWDGRTVTLYVNGLPVGQTEYAGPWYQVRSSSRLRLGFVGNGYGSTRFDADEFLIWGRALTAQEVLSCSLRLRDESADSLQKFSESAAMTLAGNCDRAIDLLRDFPDEALRGGLPEAATFLLAENLRRGGLLSEAQQKYRSLCENTDGSAFSRLALHQLVCMQQQVAGLDSEPGRCSQNLPYDEAMTEYRRQLDIRDTRRWMQQWETEIRPVVQTRCAGCHHSEQRTLPDLASLTDGWAAVDVRSTFWKQVADQILSEHMPPPDQPPLTTAEQTAILDWVADLPSRGLCEQIASDKTERWYMGAVQARHLTRLEFRNAVRDLLGVQLPDDRLPPADGAGGEGFDTSAGTLFTSVTHFEMWLQAVSYAVDRAISEPVRGESVLRLPAADADQVSLSELLTSFAAAAWRSQLQPAERQQISELVSEELKAGNSATEVLRLGLNWLLLSPKFLFVSENAPAVAGDFRLNDWELATRLALFLWSSVPDRELLQVAETGRLTEPKVLRQQLQRMLASPKAEALGEGFGLQWLGLQRLDEQQKSTELFGDYSEQIRQRQRREAVLFVSDVLRSNRPLTDLFNADDVWADRTLAEFYSLPSAGLTDHFVRLSAGGQLRVGAATLGAVLASTAYPTRTSPVLRGKWILEQFLGEDVLPPPASVPSLESEEQDGAALTAATLRQRLLLHRADEECAACHHTMDQLGFCLESFDAVGRVRSTDNGQPVDDSAELPDGTRLTGPVGLKRYLLSRSDAFCRQFARRLLGYAIGRPVDRFDECVVDSALRKLQNSQYRSGALIEQIVLSYPFQHRYSAGGGLLQPVTVPSSKE
ncbi:MAG: DUF1592 domain-containing protein [Planctomyces sp.]